MKQGFLLPSDVPAAQAIICRLCALQEEVWRAISNGDDAADCFCGEGGYWPLQRAEDFRNELGPLEFIESAVRAALAERLTEAIR